MKWVSAISIETATEAAMAHCAAGITDQLNGARPDLLLLFVSPHHREYYHDLPGWIMGSLEPRHILGCSGGGIIGAGQEIEHQAALTMIAAVLPQVRITPFQLENEDLQDLESERLAQHIGIGAEEDPQFLLLPDPFSFEAEKCLRLMDWAYPRSVKVGGLAGGGPNPGSNGLFLDRRVFRSGLVGVALSGSIQMDSLVAQGCRPIGSPMFITRCKDQMLMELNGRPPREILSELYQSSEAADQSLFQRSLFLGLEMKPQEQVYRQGDFLIRNIMGIEPHYGYLAVNGKLEETGVVQFHLRDAETSHEDLNFRLNRYCRQNPETSARGALLFSCLGRGEHLYGETGHDSQQFSRFLGDIALVPTVVSPP